jgi:hypothetical protein
VDPALADRLSETQPDAPLLRVPGDPAEASRALQEAGILAQSEA